MDPSQFSKSLRQLATAIESAKRPDRKLVASHLRHMVATLNVNELFEYVEGCWPVVSRGQVVELESDEERKPLPEGVTGYVDAHPEGADRGGYVPFLETESGKLIFYYGPAGEWQQA